MEALEEADGGGAVAALAGEVGEADDLDGLLGGVEPPRCLAIGNREELLRSFAIADDRIDAGELEGAFPVARVGPVGLGDEEGTLAQGELEPRLEIGALVGQ